VRDAKDTEPPPPDVAAVAGVTTQPAGPVAEPDDLSAIVDETPTRRIGKAEITWILLAMFGGSMAYLVPSVFSLALRVNELAPGREEVLGYLTGTAQVVLVVAGPLTGMWSDRTRSRLGRRRPFMIWGLVLGLAALLGVTFAPTILLVGACWILVILGYGTSGAALGALMADRLPDSQRGKVSGLTGLVTQLAPVLGVAMVAGYSSNTVLVFVIPALLGSLLVVPFLFLTKDADSRALALPQDRISVRTVVTSYTFSPRKYPDFAWNWLGRFVFFLGMYANTTFSTYFYAQRLGIPVSQVAGTIAVLGSLGIVAAMAGALGGGFLSDRLGRRKLFTIIGALLFVTGAIIEAFAYSMPTLIGGALLMSLAIASFGAVDQAIVFSVLPDRAQAGRYLAVVAFSQKIPSAVMPLLAPLIVGIGAVGAVKNYTLLYLIGGALALVGGSIIFTRVKSVR
jgi:MFS family permease